MMAGSFMASQGCRSKYIVLILGCSVEARYGVALSSAASSATRGALGSCVRAATSRALSRLCSFWHSEHKMRCPAT